MGCRVWGLSAWLAAATMAVGVSSVQAQDAPPVLVLPSPANSSSNPAHFLLFNGVDLWRGAFDLYGGVYWAPGGLNDDGLVTQLQLSRRIDRYDSGSTLTSRVSMLAGYRFKRGDFEVKLLVGPQFQDIDPTAPNASLRGPQLGVHGVIETWWEPTPSLLVASSWTAYSVSNGRGGRIAAGVRLFDGFWTGPELSAFSDIYSTQYRVGMHVTGWHWHDLEWSASAGYLEDNYHRRGGYLRLGVLLRH